MRWLALALLGVFLAGCSGGSPEFTVPEGADADVDIRPDGNRSTPQPYVLRIHVRHETLQGAPLGGAAVVFFDASQPAQVEAARTDAQGDAVARFYLGGTISIAAGGLSNFTVEEARNVVLGEPGESGDLTIMLFNTTRTVQVDVALPNGLGTSVQPYWADTPVTFSTTAAEAYLQRLVDLDITLTWMNSPTAFADLYVGAVSADDAELREGTDTRQLPTDASNMETLDLDEAQTADLREASLDGGGLQLRALSDSGVVTAGSLAATFVMQASFKGSDIKIS